MTDILNQNQKKSSQEKYFYHDILGRKIILHENVNISNILQNIILPDIKNIIF